MLFFSLWKENLTGKSYCCVSCFIWHTFIYPKGCPILLLLWKLVISIKVAFLCRGSISVDQSYWLIANSPLPSSIYILGTNRLGGETTRGAKRLGRKWPGGKRLVGETTGGGNGLGAKRPGFVLTVLNVPDSPNALEWRTLKYLQKYDTMAAFGKSDVLVKFVDENKVEGIIAQWQVCRILKEYISKNNVILSASLVIYYDYYIGR